MYKNAAREKSGMTVALHAHLILAATILVPLAGACTPAYALDPASIREPAPPLVTEESIIFSFKSERAGVKTVMVNGDFNRWEEPLPMKKNRNDVFVCVYDKRREKSVVLDEGRYVYRYLVDGVWIKDPHNTEVLYDTYGTELSVFTVADPVIAADSNPVRLGHNEYVFYYKNRNAKSVILVGDFNNWNPYSTPMAKNGSGLWEATVDIPPGSRYLYRFVVDGSFRTDPLNRNFVKDRFDNAFSQIELPPEPAALN
jgi:1,4-alpha-glucan branching enzyme